MNSPINREIYIGAINSIDMTADFGKNYYFYVYILSNRQIFFESVRYFSQRVHN